MIAVDILRSPQKWYLSNYTMSRCLPIKLLLRI